MFLKKIGGDTMNSNFAKLLNVMIVSFIIALFMFSIFVSQNEHHLEVCHEEDCVLCSIIHIAQNISNFINTNIVILIITTSFYIVLSRVYDKLNSFEQLSLIFQKVQFNE